MLLLVRKPFLDIFSSGKLGSEHSEYWAGEPSKVGDQGVRGKKESCSGEPSSQIHLLWLLQSLFCLLNKGWRSFLSLSPGHVGALPYEVLQLFLTSSHLGPPYTISLLVR